MGGGTEVFPDLGKHCQLSDCKQPDFLPFKCDGCHKPFCLEHRSYESHGGRRPTGVALRSRDTRAVAARVAAVRASVGGSDEVPSDFADERGDATLCRLGGSSRCRGGSACESYPRRGHTVDSPIRDRELPTHRLITVEFLSTFRYRAHQAAVREEDDEELPPDIKFSICGQHFEMSIERFAVHLGSIMSRRPFVTTSPRV
ncbi:hypothetical protein E3N88_17680 [Mikania micrantha]|uniref:AN1-type domain-containing protein n=1 Tax=Mikania micrantha TaxID=192012 RepID=A0A5N6NT33_9ASTR|nr:hypothetical protein E3N88_17680 [Mikania micrantha]